MDTMPGNRVILTAPTMPGKSIKSKKGEYREMSQEMMAADHQFKHSAKHVAFFSGPYL